MPRSLYIPDGPSEIADQLAMMMLKAPTFEDAFFIERNVESVFFQLNEGLRRIRGQLGEERYNSLVSMADRMRDYFESDPTDETGETAKGRKLIVEMREFMMSLQDGD